MLGMAHLGAISGMIFSIELLDKQIWPEETLIPSEMCFVLSWASRCRLVECYLTSSSNQMFSDTWNTRTHGYREYELDVPHNCCLILSLDIAKQIVFLLPVFSWYNKACAWRSNNCFNCALIMASKHTAYELHCESL